MDRLIAKLSDLDVGAQAAVRVIAAYDRLIAAQVPVGALTRATAALAQCTAGISRPDYGVLRFAPNGDGLDEVYPEVSRPLRFGEGLSVWLEREGIPHELDDLILERFALAARALIPPRSRLEPRDMADPALIEILVSGSHCPEDRARAIKLLGIDPYRPIRVVAVATTVCQDPAVAATEMLTHSPIPAGQVRVATIGSLAAAILQPRSDSSIAVSEWWEAASSVNGLARNTLAGVGNAVMPHHARQSWLQGKLALRFAKAGTISAVVDHDALGALALLADIPTDRLAGNPDVVAFTELAATAGGRMDLEAVEALCRTGSLRQAASSLHMHHSTIAARIRRAELKLGWNVDAPPGALRASIALHALQLLTQFREQQRLTDDWFDV